MKKVAIIATLILFFASISYAYTSPGKPQGFVSDYAGILGDSAKALNQKLSDFDSQTTIEVAVVTIPSLGDETVEAYAVKLFEEWGIGDKEKDNGVLFLIAPNERKVRIEVGYGLEGVLTDAQANGIIQKIVIPEFKAGNMQKGIMDGTDAIISVVKSEADYSHDDFSSEGSIWQVFFFFLLWTPSFFGSLLSRTKSWWLGGIIGAVVGIIMGFIFGFFYTGIISIIVLALLGLFFDYVVSKHGPRGPGGFFGGGGFGGRSSGGFGGFSGGSSGGGGSSGSW